MILEAIKIYSDVGGTGQKRKRPFISIKESIFWMLKLCPDVFKEDNFYISYESVRLVLVCFFKLGQNKT